MPRADRVLKLIQILRRHRRPVTAVALAGELGISVRTVYRDIAALAADGVPVDGAAGVGYVLAPGYDLPPLMLTAEEVEALIVGMSWVEARGDSSLAAAARDVVGKVGAVLPKELRPLLIDRMGDARPCGSPKLAEKFDVALLRKAIREQRAVEIEYRDEKGERTLRSIWPLAVGYFDLARILVAWCTLREDFRHFRTDRILAFRTGGRYPSSLTRLLKAWRVAELDRYKDRMKSRADL